MSRRSPAHPELGAAIGAAMKDAREASKKTQQEVADLTGLTQTTISSMENGRIIPSIETLVRFAYAVGCKPAELLDAL